jgi:hypothetical protein
MRAVLTGVNVPQNNARKQEATGPTLALASGNLQSMAMLTLSSVPAEEAAPFYKDFLAAFPDGRVGIDLQAQVVELEELCAGLTESGAMFRYAEGKWTIKIAWPVSGRRIVSARAHGHLSTLSWGTPRIIVVCCESDIGCLRHDDEAG